MNTDHAHLLRVARRAIEHGDRGTVAALLWQYRDEAESLRRHPGLNGKIKVERSARLAVVKRAAQGLAGMLAGDSRDTCSGPGASPWAEAQKARRKRDPLAYMKLTPGQIRAAEEIRDIFEATVRALMPGNAALDKIRVDTSIMKRDPWLELSPWVAERRVDVYLPWVERFGRVAAARGRERGVDTLGVVDLVLSVLVDHEAFWVLAKRWRVRERTLARAFRRGLDGYNAIGRAARQERDVAVMQEGTS